MSADRLREAAKVLRERAEAATAPDEMHPYGNRALPALPASAHPDEVRGLLGGTWGDYYATVHPGVGLALADWLDAEADVPYYTPKAYGTADGVTSAAHRLADLILGGTP